MVPAVENIIISQQLSVIAWERCPPCIAYRDWSTMSQKTPSSFLLWCQIYNVCKTSFSGWPGYSVFTNHVWKEKFTAYFIRMQGFCTANLDNQSDIFFLNGFMRRKVVLHPISVVFGPRFQIREFEHQFFFYILSQFVLYLVS